MAEVIEIQNNADNGNWNPFVGDETNELLRSKRFANPDRTLNENGVRDLDETYRIMQVCGNPSNPTNSETGIVIGYVQSGKTLTPFSFSVLSGLAKPLLRNNSFVSSPTKGFQFALSALF